MVRPHHLYPENPFQIAHWAVLLAYSHSFAILYLSNGTSRSSLSGETHAAHYQHEKLCFIHTQEHNEQAIVRGKLNRLKWRCKQNSQIQSLCVSPQSLRSALHNFHPVKTLKTSVQNNMSDTKTEKDSQLHSKWNFHNIKLPHTCKTDNPRHFRNEQVNKHVQPWQFQSCTLFSIAFVSSRTTLNCFCAFSYPLRTWTIQWSSLKWID